MTLQQVIRFTELGQKAEYKPLDAARNGSTNNHAQAPKIQV